VQSVATMMQTCTKDRTLRGYDLNLIAVLGISAFVVVLANYYRLDIDFPAATQLFYYMLVPLAAGFLIFRDKPRDYGIRIGRLRLGIMAVAIGLTIMALVLYGVSKIPDFHNYYHRNAIDWPRLLLYNALFMFAWEFVFRGYMTFGLERSIGISAIFVQAIPFALLHFGKPFLETLACIPGGFVLGYVAYRTRSFLPCFVIHFGMYAMMVFFASS
jgi:membrane protease YdiL (CAAX protease family)